MKNQPSITEIENEFTKRQLSYVLKKVKSLSKNNLVVEKKEGRQKIVELSAMGKALTGSYLKEEKISDVLKDFLEKKSEMENNTKNKELLDSLQESAKFFSNLCEKIVNFEGPRIENDKLKVLQDFLHT